MELLNGARKTLPDSRAHTCMYGLVKFSNSGKRRAHIDTLQETCNAIWTFETKNCPEATQRGRVYCAGGTKALYLSLETACLPQSISIRLFFIHYIT